MRNIELTDVDKDKCKEANARNGYGLSNSQLKKLFKEHKNGNEYEKALIEYRLTDINFHSDVTLMMLGKYDEIEKHYKL